MHGFLGCYSDFDPYIKHFASKYNCLAIDLPGHGRSQMYECSQLMDLIPQKSHLVGYSMGGRIALNLLSSHPDHFNKIVLLSTHLGLATEEEKRIRHYEEERWIDRLRTYGINHFINSWYQTPLFQNAPIPSYRYRQSPDLLIEAIRKFSLAKQQNFWNSLPKISRNSVFLYGEKDTAYRQTFEKLCEFGARAHLIQNSSHAIHLQNIKECIDHIERSFNV